MSLRLLLMVLVFSGVPAVFAAIPLPGQENGKTTLVDRGADGRWRYQPYSAQGDVLPDFSHCGYSRGSLICQQPPTAQNFAIGFVGPRGQDAFPRPPGWWESEGTPVEPRSLHHAQLAARRGN